MTKFLSRFLLFMTLIMSFSTLMAFESFVVKKIQIVGNQRISKEAVLVDLPINVGDEITPAKVSAAIRELYNTGFYQDVSIEREGTTLVVKLTERPSIGSLEITGLKTKDDVEKILKDNNVAVGRVYDPNVIDRVEKEILHDYLMKQRYGVKVDTKVTPQDRNRVDLVIDIYEGDVATIKEIKFVGNEAFSNSTLRRQMFHKTRNLTSWFDKSNHYSKEKLAADLEMLRSFYMDRGYINFRVESTQVSLSVDKKHVYLTINISEGEQFFFKKVYLDGDMVLDRETMQQVIDNKIKPGAMFSLKSVLQVKDTLETMLGNAGYSRAEIRIVDEIDPETRMVTLKLVVEPNKRITVRRITFSGNSLTQDEVLRRDVEQFEGTWIDTDKIKASKDAILRDGYATNIDIQTIPVPDKDDQVDLHYKIEEQRTAQVSAGISYSAADGLGGNVGADLKNFVGTGKDINFVFNHTKAQQVYNLGYVDPYFTNSGIGMGFNIYNSRSRLSKTSTVFNYLTDVTGFNSGWTFRLSQYHYFKIGFGVDHIVLRMNYPMAPIEAQNFADAYSNGQTLGVVNDGNISQGFNEYFATMGWVHNNLDNYLFPTKGWSQTISLKGNIPASELKLYKFDFDLSWFKTVRDPFVVNLRGIVGYQNDYGNKPFPFFKHYYLGGADSVRGFEERSLGPLSSQGTPFGGNVMIEGRAQLIFPPPFIQDTKTMRMALFLDAGQVYDTHNKKDLLGSDRNPTGLRYSAGIAFVWNTPMHVPISVSFAYPLNKKQGDQVRVPAFTLGTQF